MIETIEVTRIKNLLKDKIDQEVKLFIYSETRDERLGNMNPSQDPKTETLGISMIFLGVYGFKGYPLYVHGTDIKDGKEKLYRNNLDIWLDEDSSIPNHETKTELLKIDDIDIDKWMCRSLFIDDEEKLKKKIGTAEPDDKYLAEKIINGMNHYIPGQFYCRYPIFDGENFIEKVLTCLERII